MLLKKYEYILLLCLGTTSVISGMVIKTASYFMKYAADNWRDIWNYISYYI